MKFFQKPRFLVPILLLLILLIVGSIAGYAIGKYRTDVVMTDTITTRTQLVSSFQLQAVRSGDSAGSERIHSDTAYLLPGTDLELQFAIEGKSSVRSYLYVEIEGRFDAELLADGWKLLKGVTGKHGGRIYAWSEVLDGSKADLSVPILQKGLTMDAESKDNFSKLSFCGYLLQITAEGKQGEDSAKTTFINKFTQD